MKKLGLALGGGGARGLAHLPMLEAIEEYDVRIDAISGTSAGAIIGALYASGLSARDIRERIDELILHKGHIVDELIHKKQALKPLEFFDISFQNSGLLKGKRFIEKLKEMMGDPTFDDLKIPLKIVASDFWSSEQVVIEKGKVLDAVRASMGLPGVFTPVEKESRLLIDGGGVNPLPHDLLSEMDAVIAVDVMGFPTAQDQKPPGLFRTVIGMFDIMQNTIIAQRLEKFPPALYLKPEIRDVDLLDFHLAEQIYEDSESAVKKLRDWLADWKSES